MYKRQGEDRAGTLRVLGEHTLGPRGSLRAAFTGSEIRHDETLRTYPPDSASDGEFRYRQRLWSLGGETTWALLRERRAERWFGARSLSVSAGGAWDVATTPQAGGREPQDRLDEWGARAGASLALGRGNTVLHAGVSRRGRFPALRELYSGALSTFVPNPDLKPEKLVAIEAGVTAGSEGGEVQAVVFRHRLRDAVVRVRLDGPPRRFQRVNRNELESVGLELLGSRALGPVAVSGHLTWQDVQLPHTEADETNRPENLPELFGGLEGEIALALGLRASAGVDYQGNQFAIDPGSGEDAKLADGTLFHAGLSRLWPVPAGWDAAFTRLETRIAVDNATDTAVYDAFGLPEPGRRFRFELRMF
ncbi:MAG: TonB-dependent receptor [Candidatus Eisenbacteria bacterium]|nr:TonB-dependent receptor [Candidatus Eisenbacteria bacterium]